VKRRVSVVPTEGPASRARSPWPNHGQNTRSAGLGGWGAVSGVRRAASGTVVPITRIVLPAKPFAVFPSRW
jgi:hypothetical protein